MPEKHRGGDEGSLPETARFLKESRQPLQTVFQKPGMGALHVSRVEIENGANGADKVYIRTQKKRQRPPRLFSLASSSDNVFGNPPGRLAIP